MAERIERAKQAFIHRQFDEAIGEYTKAIKELPEDQLFVAYSNRGAALMNTNNIKEAIKCFRKALELNPEHYESMHNMGVAFAAAKQFDKALECFEKTLEYAPYFYASHCGKSEALASLNRFDEAADAAKDGIQEDPNEPIAHADLGFAYLKLGRFEDSVKAYERAHALKDRSTETARLHAIALSELAVACEKSADLARAMDLYTRSVQKHETTLALHNLGILHVRQNNPSKAKTVFGRALKLDPNYFPTNAALGVLHSKERCYDLALPFLVKAKELNPNHVENLYNLGLVYMKEGNFEDALKQFKALLRIDSSNQDAKLAAQLIRTAQGAGGAGSASAPAPAPPPSVSSSVTSKSRSKALPSSGASVSSQHAKKRTASVHKRSSSLHKRGVATASSSASATGSHSQRTRAPSASASARSSTSSRHRAPSVASSKKRSSSKAHAYRKAKFYTVEEVQVNPPPAGVDPSQREMYLHDQDFVELFGMSKEEFLELPYWKQTLEKKRYNLF